MSARNILADLLECGIEPGVTADRQGIVVPAGVLTQAQRDAVLLNKFELIESLLEKGRIAVQLMTAALRRCDQFNDNEEARQAMRDDVQAIPAHQRQEWLEYFIKERER